mmetsp:Transcript_3540/g.7818  ORF Transcript_3540/g.7818 Transcript_3540/m.7818 type:complete len:222 (+) Transcript_3540:260-925(+)|eukprot:CAMPEP_0172307264 /NCGR_PEP_ID=MMETSP1058-20130122/8151_1 /TAXON_ID=83371 /ORGANISM="Detonula confervacea, Strain CCMP 353" /LENGTH=221 /DNA_ID=CAMNT_0013019377 /DNA_START=190 /DNA_END=855 /DNA_ORIENTATION=+
MSAIRKYLTNIALAVPPIIIFKDNFYSLYRVEGASMEPALHHGDVLLVRKSDVFPKTVWKRWMSVATSFEQEIEHQNAMKVMAMDASSGRLIGDMWTGNTYLNPPTIHQLGSVIVFRAPDAEKYPSSEYRVKRVAGLGGQLVSVTASGRYHGLERIPPFALWVEGDNQESNGNRSVDSRMYGAVCKNSVIGIGERIVWPPSRWGIIPRVTPSVPRSWWQNY